MLCLDVGLGDTQVFELAYGVVGGEAFQEALEGLQAAAPVTQLFLTQQGLPPEAQTGLQVGTHSEHAVDQFGNGFQQLLDGLFLALGGHLRKAAGETQQFKK